MKNTKKSTTKADKVNNKKIALAREAETKQEDADKMQIYTRTKQNNKKNCFKTKQNWFITDFDLAKSVLCCKINNQANVNVVE